LLQLHLKKVPKRRGVGYKDAAGFIPLLIPTLGLFMIAHD
jgi:hypothetical protein